jgi:hypothetical protein
MDVVLYANGTNMPTISNIWYSKLIIVLYEGLMTQPFSLYNTLTKQIEPFVPIEEGKIRLYVCGMTVYDHIHVGHGREPFPCPFSIKSFSPPHVSFHNQ